MLMYSNYSFKIYACLFATVAVVFNRTYRFRQGYKYKVQVYIPDNKYP